MSPPSPPGSGPAGGHVLFSARIGCQLYQPMYGIDLAALCLRS
ncbi:MAG TPA: hypothetical protein VMT69_09540 [Kineosporiaceae bacterium]|nr:hypothetical protein [Kineosporiaceae bacterium]